MEQRGHIVSPLSVLTVHIYKKKWFLLLSFKKISVLDSYFIHQYIIIKYRSSSILGKIHQLLQELWPFFQLQKMVSV